MAPKETTPEHSKQEQLHEDARRRAVAVRLQIVGQNAVYQADKWQLETGDDVIVPTEQGLEIGTVIGPAPSNLQDGQDLPRIERPLTEADQKTRSVIKILEKQAFAYCKTQIKKSQLSMKLISTSITQDKSTATFYFTAGQRVDFRALIKSLAKKFQMRIDMRQIGVRDAARHTGGIGICGSELCCSTWIPEFKPISIRMAKDQNLTLNNLKLSGVCGRLRCCLEYEHEVYQEYRKGLPKLNKRVLTPKGEGKTRDINILKRTIRVQFEDGSYDEFPAAELQRPEPPQQAATKKGKPDSKSSPKGRKKQSQTADSPANPPKKENETKQKSKKRRPKQKKSAKNPIKKHRGESKDSTAPQNSDKKRDT